VVDIRHLFLAKATLKRPTQNYEDHDSVSIMTTSEGQFRLLEGESLPGEAISKAQVPVRVGALSHAVSHIPPLTASQAVNDRGALESSAKIVRAPFRERE
jgi:hypothetical protein